MDSRLQHLLQQQAIWQGKKQWSSYSCPAQPTAYDALDQQLCGGGLPQGALTEILYRDSGIGELSLLMPMLAKLSEQKRWILWVAPPFIPYAPALSRWNVDISRVLVVHPKQIKDLLWTLEQGLKSGSCAAVLGWLEQVDNSALRRLQLAAEQGNSLGILFRPEYCRQQPSPAAVRLALTAAPDNRVQGEVIKRRGGWPVDAFEIPLKSHRIHPHRPH